MRLLMGGSPCTYWSIAQTKNRETEASGVGWELFLNYVISRDKYQPDYFLYENNKSMSAAIREQITRLLGVKPILINSALVSAQSRQRLYWVGRREPDESYSQVSVEQPEDRGILLRDILETGACWREKAYTLKASMCHQNGPSNILKAITTNGHFSANGVAEPVRIGTIESEAREAGLDSQQYRVYSPDGKGVTLCGQGGGVGAKTGLYAAPVRVGDMPNAAGEVRGGQAHRVYDINGKGVALTARPNGGGVDGPLYSILQPLVVREATTKGYTEIAAGECVDLTRPGSKTRRGRAMREKSNYLTTSNEYYEYCGTVDKPVYEVRGGQITIGGAQYPIKLLDGFYIIRKLTVTECKRLQTVPESYEFPVSDTQAYRMLGNGWTVDVIAHILAHIPEISVTAEPVEVLSMYDGMSCGRLALNKLGAAVTRYYATEIDKYAIKTTQHNFPDTVQLGDAFQVREDGWKI